MNRKDRIDLALMIIGSDAARKIADEIAKNRDAHAIGDRATRCAGKNLSSSPMRTVRVPSTAEFGTRSEAADFIAMLATAEAFKLIAGYAENPSRATIEFDGYETRVRVNP